MKRRDSILFKLDLLFGMTLLLMVIAGFFLLRFEAHNYQRFAAKEAMGVLRELFYTHGFDDPKLRDDLLLEAGFVPSQCEEARYKGRPLKKRRFKPHFRDRDNHHHHDEDHHKMHPPRGFKHPELRMYHGDLHLITRHRVYEYQDTRYFKWAIFGGLGLFGLFLFGIHRTLRRSMSPLKHLEREIGRFAQGEEGIDTRLERHDEVAVVSNAFDDAVRRIKRMQSSRTMMFRHLMHELNTPLLKLRFYAEGLKEGEIKHGISRTIHRLESIMQELIDVEHIGSEGYVLTKERYRVRDLIDEALELLECDEDVVACQAHLGELKGDYKLTTIIFKNVIDNGIKHASKEGVRIEAVQNGVMFSNAGDALAKPLEYYCEPFVRGDDVKHHGFGLGLYLMNEGCKRQGWRLLYEHDSGVNRFTITWHLDQDS